MKVFISILSIALLVLLSYSQWQRARASRRPTEDALKSAEQSGYALDRDGLNGRRSPAGRPKKHSLDPATVTNPPLRFSGKILRHEKGALYVKCDRYRSLPPGYIEEDVLGTFYLVGHPRTAELPDGYPVEFEAQHAGLHEYTDQFRLVRTVRRIVYFDRPAAEAADKTPWIFKSRSSLDRRAY